MEAATYPIESEPNQMEVRDLFLYFNISRGDGNITFKEEVNSSCRNLFDSQDLIKVMRFNTKDNLTGVVKRFH